MPLETTHGTAAQSLFESPAVAEAVEKILHELREAQARITAARPPQAELAESYEQTLTRFGDARGRPPVYPYVGAGLGHGPLVELADGSVKWDMICGVGVHAFGHSDPDLVATALRAALSDTIMQGNLQFNAEAVEFAELLLGEASTTRLRHCFLTNSGAMANESAFKVCLQANAPASRVLAFSHGFAGRSTAMAQITDNPGNRVGLPVSLPVDYVPFYDRFAATSSIQRAASRLREHLYRYPAQHACFLMELIQGEGGINVAPPEFFEPLMELCREQGIAVWVDEVQTFGRTPRLFYLDQLGLGEYVDVLTVGKLSQVCACLFTDLYNPKPGLLSGTFIGSTVGLRTGLRILQRLRDGGYYGDDGRIAGLFEAFSGHAAALVEKHPDWFPPVPRPGGRRVADLFGGVGGMMRFTPFGGRKAMIMNFLRRLFDRGVIAFYCGHDPYHVRFLPPVGAMQPEQFGAVFQIVEAALGETAAEPD